MRRALLPPIAAALALGIAGQAQAVVLVTPQGQPVGGMYQRWANEMRVPSVRRETFGVPPGTSCPWAGCFWMETNQIWIAPNAWLPREELYHELGHAYDFEHMTDRDRRTAARLMHDVGKHWDESQPPDPHGGASDDFAEEYAFCALDRGKPVWQSMSPPPLWSRNAGAFCKLIVRVRNQVGVPGVLFTPQAP